MRATLAFIGLKLIVDDHSKIIYVVLRSMICENVMILFVLIREKFPCISI